MSGCCGRGGRGPSKKRALAGVGPREPDQPTQGRPGGAPSPADPTQELVQSIHEMGKVIAKEVGSALGEATREVGGALSDAAREVRKNTAQSAARPRPAPQDGLPVPTLPVRPDPGSDAPCG